ncbi:hypothetical protein SAZ11_16755 [Streptomyces sp. FXJ1.4098]|nr:hypothetical protein [Streptomyces sp. FXJ1.4098]
MYTTALPLDAYTTAITLDEPFRPVARHAPATHPPTRSARSSVCWATTRRQRGPDGDPARRTGSTKPPPGGCCAPC